MEAATDPSLPPPAGHVLATERERQGLSRVEVAQRLHMSPSQVEALETGEYSRLPKGPFLRGFVRNYAKALGLDADTLIEQLAHEGPRESAPRIVVPSQNIRFDPIGERLSNPYVKAAGLAVVAIVLGFAAMYWWLFIRPTPPAQKSVAREAAPARQAPAPVAPITDPSPPVPAPVKTEPPTASEPRKAPEAARAAETAKAATAQAPAAAAPGEGVLQFHFKGESWVEVRDARNKVIMQRLNAADSDATVSGRPPLAVIIGNATEVTLRYKGRDFPLEPHTKVAVARFTLE